MRDATEGTSAEGPVAACSKVSTFSCEWPGMPSWNIFCAGQQFVWRMAYASEVQSCCALKVKNKIPEPGSQKLTA